MRWIVLLLVPVGAWLAGCSPALNWREVRLGDAPALVLLPCQPDQAERTVPLAGESVMLHMSGCDAAGATFAVSQIRMRSGAPAAVALAQWRTATLARLQARDVREQPFQPAGSLTLPQSVRVAATGQRAGGQPVQAQAAWFARSAPEGLWLFHAVVYADAVNAQAADTFFDGLRLQGTP
jgi:hypothetical protein